MRRGARKGSRVRPFTEKSFYLGEFRDRTLAIALVPGARHDVAGLEQVLKELEANPTDVVLFASDLDLLARLVSPPLLEPGPRLAGAAWRGLRGQSRVGVAVAKPRELAAAASAMALELGVPKLVWLDPAGGLERGRTRLSFVDVEELRELLREGPKGEPPRRVALLREIERTLRAGLPAVNLCTSAGLGDELFTYAGSGTLFTSQGYVDVRRIGIDDYDAADDLIARGVSEGYLAARSAGELDRVFANGYGAFVEGRHLAGIGALLPCTEVNAGEIVSLYTLTRFLGEGIGGHLVEALCEIASERGFEFVFACTTTERVAGFFERNGFTRVDGAEIPEEKWRHYDRRRRPKVRSLKRFLG